MNFNNPLPVEFSPHRLHSLRDECQELVRLKRMTQEEVDELLGKPSSPYQYKPPMTSVRRTIPVTSRSNKELCV